MPARPMCRKNARTRERPSVSRSYHFFFFQAEDGIRDLTVTGVQTCALPISPQSSLQAKPRARSAAPRRARESSAGAPRAPPAPGLELPAPPRGARAVLPEEEWRSEERRVGEGG